MQIIQADGAYSARGVAHLRIIARARRRQRPAGGDVAIGPARPQGFRLEIEARIAPAIAEAPLIAVAALGVAAGERSRNDAAAGAEQPGAAETEVDHRGARLAVRFRRHMVAEPAPPCRADDRIVRVIERGEAIVAPHGARLHRPVRDAFPEQPGRVVEGKGQRADLPQHVGQHDLRPARAVDLVGAGVQREGPRRNLARIAPHAVDIEIDLGGQRGRADEGRQRSRDQIGLQGEIGPQLHAADPRRARPVRRGGDGVADPQGQQLVGKRGGPGAVEPHRAASPRIMPPAQGEQRRGVEHAVAAERPRLGEAVEGGAAAHEIGVSVVIEQQPGGRCGPGIGFTLDADMRQAGVEHGRRHHQTERLLFLVVPHGHAPQRIEAHHRVGAGRQQQADLPQGIARGP